MPTVTGIGLALTIDVLTRVSFVLTAGLLLAHTARRDAALRHAILVAGLAAAFIMPAAMLTMQVLPVSRFQLGLLSRVRLDGSAAVAVVSPRPPGEPQHRSASLDHPAPEIVPTRSDEARLEPGHGSSARSDEPPLGPLALSWLNVPYGRLIASGLLSALLFGAIVKVTGLGFSLVRLRRIVERARPVTGDQVLSILGLIQRRIPMRHPPRLLESGEVSAPVAAGVIGNYVLLPTGWAGSLRPGEMMAVLCHEFAHLARRDHRVVVLQELLASALWFHPLVHLFNRMLNRMREEVCDNHAIAMVDRASYCEALLLLAVGRPGASPRGATSMWTRHWPLEDRVRGILDERRPTRTGISGVARSATVTFSLSACGLIAMPQLISSQAGDRIAPAAKANSSPGAKAGPAANEMTRSIIKSFAVNGEKLLRFENLAGRVELVPSNGPTVEVEAIVRVSELAEGDVKRLIDDIRWVEAPTEDGESRWGLVLPEGRYPTVRYPVSGESPPGVTTVSHLGREIRLSDRPGESIPAVEFDLRIAVPPQARLAVHNVVGPVGGADLAAPLQATTHAGSIQLRNVRAPITASSDLGPIMITNLESDASLRTGSGGIELTRVAGGRVDLTTRSAGCRIVQPPDAEFTLRNVGKRPVVVFADGVKRSSPRSGDQRTEFLSRGSGGPIITVDAGAGDCVIESGP
jgi:beta-lactamase regulating signal transducer with metallopeptidase domain